MALFRLRRILMSLAVSTLPITQNAAFQEDSVSQTQTPKLESLGVVLKGHCDDPVG